MREILFRGQTRRFGERVWMNGEKVPSNWVYGGIFQGTGDFSVIYGADKENFTGADIGKHTVYTDTVGQYTGLTDKNGKKIFEGDIVLEYDACGKLAFRGCVYWNTLFSGWHIAHYRNMFGGVAATYEVIGNIHDNPELLEDYE